MDSLLVTPSNPEDLAFIKRLVEKLNAQVRILSEEEKEDIGLGILMMEADRTDTVSREEIMRKLGH